MSDLVVQQNLPGMQPTEAATSLLDVISKAVADPRMDVEKMRALLDMHERIMKDQREVAFMDAMSRLHEKLPVFEKHGRAKNSRFAKLEDIHIITKPLLAEEGFSLKYNEESSNEKTVTFVLWVSHKAGHKEPTRLTVTRDESAVNKYDKSIRPAIQDDGSTVSYARRYLLKMALDIVEKDEDSDGENPALITDEQVKTIETLLADTKSNLSSFCTMIAGVDRLSDIPARDYRRIINALEIKAKQQHGKVL